MAGQTVAEHVILRSTMHVRLEFSEQEHRLDFRASSPRGTTLPLDKLLGIVTSLCKEPATSTKREPDWDGICEELTDVAEASGDLSCSCEHDADASGSQFVVICHAVD